MSRDILGFLFLVLAIVIAILFFTPKVHEVRTVTINKRAKSALVEAREKRVQSLKQVQAAFAQQPDRIKKITTFLPSEPQVPELLVAVEALGKESGVTISAIVPQVSSDESGVFVTLSGEGSLPAVEKLTALIGDNGRPMSVQSVNYLRTQDGKALSFTLVIRSPYNNPSIATADASGEEL